MKKSFFARWRASFVAGLLIVLPGIITLAVVKWVFGTITSFTDTLLFFLPYVLSPKHIYKNGMDGAMFWCWSVLAIVLAVVLISAVGVITRYYFGKRLIMWADSLMLRVPVLNKIYGTIKQVDDAFSSGKKSSFQTVVLVEYPREGIYSIGFITSEQRDEVSKVIKEKCVTVFIPTTPIPTSGFLVLVPEKQVTKLDITVAEGFKYIISLGALAQDAAPPKIK
ncbi:MAG TPA: DUF502 domain-containing protein [Candidatus Sulfotelmatobacter sp.]|nr:DUF502 domain-containing protein [Candidatus Sulfotelmatobacter sp.]